MLLGVAVFFHLVIGPPSALGTKFLLNFNFFISCIIGGTRGRVAFFVFVELVPGSIVGLTSFLFWEESV